MAETVNSDLGSVLTAECGAKDMPSLSLAALDRKVRKSHGKVQSGKCMHAHFLKLLNPY